MAAAQCAESLATKAFCSRPAARRFPKGEPAKAIEVTPYQPLKDLRHIRLQILQGLTRFESLAHWSPERLNGTTTVTSLPAAPPPGGAAPRGSVFSRLQSAYEAAIAKPLV